MDDQTVARDVTLRAAELKMRMTEAMFDFFGTKSLSQLPFLGLRIRVYYDMVLIFLICLCYSFSCGAVDDGSIIRFCL